MQCAIRDVEFGRSRKHIVAQNGCPTHQFDFGKTGHKKRSFNFKYGVKSCFKGIDLKKIEKCYELMLRTFPARTNGLDYEL